MKNFVITDFCNVLYIEDCKGKKNFKNRHYASFIITVKGKIQFSYDGGYVVSDADHAVFLPKGLTYTNKCIENAQSYVFNFYTKEQYEKPMALSSIHQKTAEEAYRKISHLCLNDSLTSKMLIFCELYELAVQLFKNSLPKSNSEKLLSCAVRFMYENYSDSSLRIPTVAEHCFISEIYLRKLFFNKYNTTPFKYLTEIRMNKARLLAMEKIPIGEIARQVGYSDVYQFSRAYKRFYGFSPSDN